MSDDQVDDDGALFPAGEIPRAGFGRHELSAQRAVAAAISASSLLAGDDDAVISAVYAGARALDQAELGAGPKATYATASILSSYLDALAAAGLAKGRIATPASGAADFLADLGPTPPAAGGSP